jgi:hypothetical protein
MSLPTNSTNKGLPHKRKLPSWIQQEIDEIQVSLTNVTADPDPEKFEQDLAQKTLEAKSWEDEGSDELAYFLGTLTDSDEAIVRGNLLPEVLKQLVKKELT